MTIQASMIRMIIRRHACRVVLLGAFYSCSRLAAPWTGFLTACKPCVFCIACLPHLTLIGSDSCPNHAGACQGHQGGRAGICPRLRLGGLPRAQGGGAGRRRWVCAGPNRHVGQPSAARWCAPDPSAYQAACVGSGLLRQGLIYLATGSCKWSGR